jgi:hypothetical protein
VAASYGKLSPAQKEAIYELKKAKKSGREIRRICAQGYKDLEPFSVSAQHANTIGRQLMIERDELFTATVHKMPPGQAVHHLARRLIVLADRESLRLERLQRVGKLDAVKLAKLAGAVVKVHELVERIAAEPPGPQPQNGDGAVKKGDSQAPARAPTFADELLEEEEPAPAPEPEGPAIADTRMRGAQPGSAAAPDPSPPARKPKREAVPW